MIKRFDTSLWEKALEEEYQRRENERAQALERSKFSLKQYFRNQKVKKVYLVGSVVQAGKFYPFSDIDIAVEGLKEEYLKTRSSLEALLERDVDLIELEKCRFRASIEERGVRIL